MTVLPFRWHGSARLARIEAAVRGHAADWLRDWAAAPARTRGEVALAAPRCHAVPAEGECWLVLRPEAAGAGTLVLRGPDFLLEQLGADLADAQVGARGLGTAIARRALAAFGQALSGSGVAVETAEPLSQSRLEARRGMAHLAWSVGTLVLDLFLDAALCDRLAPPLSREAPGLVRREEALREEPVALHAVLDLGPATLEDALSLRPGDVIRTETPLAALLRLHAGDGECIATGSLVAAGPHRGLRIARTSRRTP